MVFFFFLMLDVTLRTNLLFIPFNNANVHSFFYGPFGLQIINSTHTTVLLFFNFLFSPVLALFDGGHLLNSFLFYHPFGYESSRVNRQEIFSKEKKSYSFTQFSYARNMESRHVLLKASNPSFLIYRRYILVKRLIFAFLAYLFKYCFLRTKLKKKYYETFRFWHHHSLG